MAYRKLGVDNKHRRSMLANITKDVIMNGKVQTTETRAKEVRKFVDKMITYGKDGSLVSRRKALAFLQNDDAAVKKVFNELAPKYATRNGGYTRSLNQVKTVNFIKTSLYFQNHFHHVLKYLRRLLL